MFCSSCGAAVAQGLSYCKHCGAKLSTAKNNDLSKQSELFSDSLVNAIVAVFVLGIGTAIGLMAMMKKLLNLNTDVIIAAGLLIFALMTVIEAVFIWMLLSQRRGVKKASEMAAQKTETTGLSAQQTQALPEAMPTSITEYTTRTLEPVYNERKSD